MGFAFVDKQSFYAALFGGMMPVIGTLWLLWYHHRAARVGSDARKSLTILYRCAIERFVVIAVLFAFGLGVMGLEPIPLLSGFAVGQLLFLISGSR